MHRSQCAAAIAPVQHNSRHGRHDWDGDDEEDCDPKGSVRTMLALNANSVSEGGVVTLDCPHLCTDVSRVVDVFLSASHCSCVVRRAQFALAPTATTNAVVALASGSDLVAVCKVARHII